MAQIGETELDVRALWRALWRRAWLLIFLTVVVAAGTYVGLGYVEPLYTADTRLLIEQRESPLTRPREDAGAPSSDFDESAIQSQVEVLRSREIAEAVIDKLDLTHRPEFDPARQPSILRSLLVLLGLDENPADSSIRQRVMESYFNHLSVYALQQSRVIGVDFSASKPDLSAEVANAVADSFVALQQDAKRQSALAATSWLQQEIERLRGRVAESEQAVADYRQSRGLFESGADQSGSDAGNLSTQQLGEINAELARARAARAEAEARAQLVEKSLAEGTSLDSSEEVLNSQLIQRLRERQGALRAQMAELSTTLLPTHPRIRALEGQIANLEGQIREETVKVLDSLKTAARVAAAREDSLTKSLDEAKGDVSRSNDEGIELRALQREATAQRDLLESFLARYREAAARTDANYLPADARIISRAVAPSEPSFPKKTMMAIAAAIATLLIASAIALLAEFMSGRAFRVIGYGGTSSAPLVDEAVEEASRPPLHQTIPDAEPDEIAAESVHWPDGPKPELEPEPEAVAFDEEPAGASDMALATELLDQTPQTAHEEEQEEPAQSASQQDEPPADEKPESEPRRSEQPKSEQPETPTAAVAEAAPETETETEKSGTAGLGEIIANSAVRLALFAGAEGGEGAGAIAFSAARQAARHKLRCIVIDAGRMASETLGHERPGLGDLLAGDAAFGEVIQRDETARVHVIPLGSTDKHAPLQRLRLVIGALTHTYDKVIVVVDKLDDWPDEDVRPDIAAIVCGPNTTEFLRTELYDFALARGAHSAIIVRYSSDLDLDNDEESAAA